MHILLSAPTLSTEMSKSVCVCVCANAFWPCKTSSGICHARIAKLWCTTDALSVPVLNGKTLRAFGLRHN